MIGRKASPAGFLEESFFGKQFSRWNSLGENFLKVHSHVWDNFWQLKALGKFTTGGFYHYLYLTLLKSSGAGVLLWVREIFEKNVFLEQILMIEKRYFREVAFLLLNVYFWDYS